MRILKRNLAFMLAMIMALSLTAFAGYEDYPDVDELTYVEAVDVLTELGIVEGSNGKLLPTGNLTRAQAAKLIAYTMLGKKAADALQADVATFVDVPTYHWAAGYVEYCANEGIVGGNGDGTFAPEANVTASQFAKMLLCAVGYGEKGEFTGANWDDAVNSLATKLGVFDENLDVVFANAVTREEAFLYTFNALTKVMEVTYSADADEYYSGTVFNSIKKFDEDETLGAKLYDLNTKDGEDVFGHEGYFWYKNNKKITGLYIEEADAVYTTAVKGNVIYSDLDLRETTYATVIINGEVQDDEVQLKKGLKNDLLDDNNEKFMGNGVLTEAYLDEDTMEVTLIVVDTYLAQVTDVNADDDEIDLDIYFSEDNCIVTESDIVTKMDLEKGDYVLVTYADNDVQSIKAVEEVLGQLDNRGQSSTYTTMDGTKYSHSANLIQDCNVAGTHVCAQPETYAPAWDVDMVMMLDEYGYMIGLIPAEGAAKLEGYVLVRDSQGSTTEVFLNQGSVKAEVMFMDTGDVEVVDIATRRNGTGLTRNTQFWDPTNGTDGGWSPVANERYIIDYGFYGYYMDANDEMRLLPLNAESRKEAQVLSVEADADKVSTNAVWGNEADANVKNDAKTEKFTFGTDNKTLKINSKTVLNLVSKDGVETIEGYKNFEIDETNVDALVVYNNSSKYVKEIYVVNGDLHNNVFGYYDRDEHMLDPDGEWITLYVAGEPVTYKLSDATVLNYDYLTTQGVFFTKNDVAPTADNLLDGVYEFTLDGNTLESLTLVAAERAATGKFYTMQVVNYGAEWMQLAEIAGDTQANMNDGLNRKYTLADDVQIYDITEDGVESSIGKNDKVIFVVDQDAVNFDHDTFDATAVDTVVVSHVYIVGHISYNTVQPDTDDTYALTVSASSNASLTERAVVTLTKGTHEDGKTSVQAYIYKDGKYTAIGNAIETVSANGNYLFDAAESGAYYFELLVDGVKTGVHTSDIYLTK